MNRIDIKQHDVFVSWTGADRVLKDEIVSYLEADGITCLESDYACSGDFRQWSREAVKECNIFLLVCSESTFESKYVPIEIEHFRELYDYNNRIVPVCTSLDVFSREPWGISEYASAAIMGEEGLTEELLELILHKVNSLNINLLDKVYARGAKEEYIRLIPLAGAKKLPDREADFSELYVGRSICEVGENGYGKPVSNPQFICKSEDVIFISGPAGCGKSRYIDQIRQSADEDTITVVLSCCKFSESGEDVFSAMYREFRRICGNRYFYSAEDFKSLINNRHLLLVLDGMDEISTAERRRKLVSRVEEYYRTAEERTTLVFTGRNESDADLLVIRGKKVRHFRLEKLDEENIRTLSEKLFLLFGNKEKNEDFYIRIKDLSDEIKANPLLLSQLAIIYNSSGEIPGTVVGIYDAISEITLSFDKNIDMEVPENYRDMVETKISAILKSFSSERYSLLSKGKAVETGKIFRHILKEKYGDEAGERADFLVDYLQSRAILIDGDFYHKMFLEYFTAVKYYENAFDDYDEIENADVIGGLFENYSNPYWAPVIKMFLVKADSCIDRGTTKELYSLIMTYGIWEYTVLFDTCRDLIRHKEEAQLALVTDILKKSVCGVYPPYGPLFWYVTEYGLYEVALLALNSLREGEGFEKMLALVRDVCCIFGGKHTAEAVTSRVKGAELYAGADLTGVRNALCQLFYLGDTDFEGGADIYPRCFNVAETKAFAEQGCGIMGTLSTPFEDELGLFSHDSIGVIGDEYVGLVSCRYDIAEAEKLLTAKSCRKVCGLILSPGKNTELQYISFNRNHVRVVYIPENIATVAEDWKEGLELSLDVACAEGKTIYFKDKVLLPKGIEKISKNMFYGCKGLKTVHITAGVKEIGDMAFYGCTSLEFADIPEGVEKISYGAFASCTILPAVSVPKTVEIIGESAFHDCRCLAEVNLSEGLKVLGMGAFYMCRSLTEIKLPQSLTVIGAFAFSGCKSLKSVNIPCGIQTIWGETFAGCESLTSVVISEGVKEIFAGAFTMCASLEWVKLPENLEKLGDAAFSHCMALKKVNIPGGVSEIPRETFYGCASLSLLDIPESVMVISDKAFGGCAGLHTVTLSSKTKFSPNSFECTTEVILMGDTTDGAPCDITIPHGTTVINEEEFYGDESIRTVSIPDTVTEIGKSSFAKCENMISADIPDSVISIGEMAFSGCSALERVKLPSGITSVEPMTFNECTSLIQVEIPYGTKKIGSCAFSGCTSLKTVNVPQSVTNIGASAFENCTSLEKMHIPHGVTELPYALFAKCSSLDSVVIPCGVTKIEASAFAMCTALSTLEIPDGVIKIDRYAFRECSALTSVVIPYGVTELGDGAFWGCEHLASVRLPEGLTRIERETFFRCRALTSVNIPRGVKAIDIWAFLGCRSLGEIEIPDTVENIGHGAFLHCEKLKSVVIPQSVRIIGDSVFSGCTALKYVKISRKFEDDTERIFGEVKPETLEFWE